MIYFVLSFLMNEVKKKAKLSVEKKERKMASKGQKFRSCDTDIKL